MNKFLPLAALALLTQFSAAPAVLAQASAAQAAGKVKPSPLAPSELVAAAPTKDWTAIPASDLLVMDLAPDAKGHPRRVVIQLMPPPFSQGWIGNVRKLAAAHWWDRLSINRVQDNYVVQWGDANADDKVKAKALPAGLATMPESGYVTSLDQVRSTIRQRQKATFIASSIQDFKAQHPKAKPKHLEAAAAQAAAAFDGSFEVYQPRMEVADLIGKQAGFVEGWSVAADEPAIWPVHCYGMVGVGRDLSPNTGSGAELYVVIGHAPRHLDRNIALVGRVIEGIEFLSSLPRGHGALGFYDLAQGDERVTITAIRPGTEVKDLPSYEYLSTDSASFAAYADARANRRDPFFIRPAGGADICNIPVPVRRVKA